MSAWLSLFVAVLLSAAEAENPTPQPPPQTVSPQVINRVHDLLLPALVEVRIAVREDKAAAYETRSGLDLVFDQYVRQRLPFRSAGIRIAPDGTVLIRDPNLSIGRYAKIEFVDQTGAVTEGRIAAVLENYAAVLLEPLKRPAAPLPHVAFESGDLKPGRTFVIGTPAFLEDRLCLALHTPRAATTARFPAADAFQILWWRFGDAIGRLAPSSAPVVFDLDGRPLGMALDNALWQTPDGADSWIGTKFVADRRLTPQILNQIRSRITAAAQSAVKEIEIHFRSDSRMAQQSQLEEGKLILYGLLLDKAGTVFLPTQLNRDSVRQIESIFVHDGAKSVEADFRGLFRTVGAILLRAKGLSGKPAVLLPDAAMPRGKIFYTLSVRRRFGRRHEKVDYNRYLDVAIGYKGIRQPEPQKPMRVGDLIADEEGRFLGFYAPYRREERDEIKARTSPDARTRRKRTRVYLFSETAPLLKNPKAHLDPEARPMTRKEERRLVWLGVEYQRLNGPLARALKVEGPTRDGARGLLVTSVYESSPARKLGITIGDVLLAVNLPQTGADIDLAPRSAPAYRSKQTRTRWLWRSRRNYLTFILTLIGEGRKVRLTLIHDGKEQVVAFDLEKAPVDFDTADRYQDTAIGLTVRELTYEVRSVLKLPADAPGVIVSQVEPGGKAAVSQIRPHEIITQINDRPVTSPREFETFMRTATVRGRVELLVTRLGQSRIVEIDLTPSPL